MKARVHTDPSGQRLLAGLVALAALITCFALGGAKASAATCSNEAIREAQVSATLPGGTTFLPNCMALELVSPPKKYNQYAEAPNFSANGDRVKFFSLAALAETPRLSSIFDPYIASRTKTGWVTEATTGSPDIASGTEAFGIACAYANDLSHWAFFGSTATQRTIGILTAFRGTLGGGFGPMGPTMVPVSTGPSFGPLTVGESHCEGASADASHFLFAIKQGAVYLPGDPISGNNISHVYEAYLDEGVPSVALLARDKDGLVHGGSCGTVVGRRGSPDFERGTVSPDASRIYFTTVPDCGTAGADTRIMVRQQTPAGPLIAELFASECTRVSPACQDADGDEHYLGASQEGSRVFFSTSRQLADSDRDEAGDLYLYDGSRPTGEHLTQITAGDDTAPTPGEGAEYLGLADFSGDGTRAYFVAKGVLTTTQNEAGMVAQVGEPNLYLYQRDPTYPNGRTVFIATLAEGDAATWSSTPGEWSRATAAPRLGVDLEDLSVGGDGRILVFETTMALEAGDTDGGKADLYRYDSDSGALERITAADPGGEDNGAFSASAPGTTSVDIGPIGASFNRWVSEDGETIIFNSAEKLDPLDTNSTLDPYIWHEGELAPLPFPAEQPTVSMSGNSVAFAISDPLLPEDGDGTQDVYVARANGGYPIIVPPAPCQGEACQGAPGQRPGAQSISSEAPRAGNPKQAAPCRKGQARKRGRCVKKQKRQRKVKAGKANRKQGGRK